ncbi:hypothetical protein H4R35_003281 [Dimargaris xerosporica]|nr:hypothetical protein H4R35_003281 [Dimargaris xerosporica]
MPKKSSPKVPVEPASGGTATLLSGSVPLPTTSSSAVTASSMPLASSMATTGPSSTPDPGRGSSTNNSSGASSPQALWQRMQLELLQLDRSHQAAAGAIPKLQRVRQQLDTMAPPPPPPLLPKRGAPSLATADNPSDHQIVLANDLADIYEQGITQAQHEKSLIQDLLGTLKSLQAALGQPMPGSKETLVTESTPRRNSHTNGNRPNARAVTDASYEYDSASSTSSSYTSITPVMVGTNVAAKTSKPKDRNEEWILAVVTHYYTDKHRYQVEDVVKDESGKKPKYILSAKSLIPLPNPVPLSPNGTTVASVTRRGSTLPKPSQQFAPRHKVVALYPNTTCFYRATIVASLDQDSASPHYGSYLLRFEDDDEIERYIHHSVVLDMPRYALHKAKGS